MANNLTINLNEGPCADSCSTTPANLQVRAFYQGMVDAGHVYGPFSSVEAAERAVQVLCGRDDVLQAVIEPAVS